MCVCVRARVHVYDCVYLCLCLHVSLSVHCLTGTSDPYVKLKLGTGGKRSEYKTAPVYKTLFPVWGEECILYCDPEEDDLHVSVYDKDG